MVEDAAQDMELVTEAGPELQEQVEAQVEMRDGDGPSYTDSDQEIVWDTSGLDEDWLLFAGQLGQAHLEALFALQETSGRLYEIAEKYGTMPALLLDEINELAMETIGDLLVDGESIAEDYIDYFARLRRVQKRSVFSTGKVE